jgi:hypothetical protein
MAAGEPSDTIPPPNGEEDAYNATTKVGAMPAELMAKLRAEGLLPSEAEERRAVPRPGAPRPPDKSTLRNVAAAPAVPNSSPPPSLVSRPPARDEETLLRPEEAIPQARLPSLSDDDSQSESLRAASSKDDDAPEVEVLTSDSSAPEAPTSGRPLVETPVAFSSPPSVLASTKSPTEDASLAAAPAANSGARRVVLALVIMALVGFALVMALRGHGR